jgi:hypothetical protein
MNRKDDRGFQLAIDQQNDVWDIRIKISTEKMTALAQRLAWAIVTGLIAAGIFSGDGEFIFGDKPPPKQGDPVPVLESPVSNRNAPPTYQ